MVFAQGYYGIFHLAESSLLVGVKLKDVRQASARVGKPWPSMGSQSAANRYVGISVKVGLLP